MENKANDPLSIIRPSELCELLSISMSNLYSKIDKGEMPSRVRLGDRAVGFYRRDIEKWLQERTDEETELEPA